MKTAKMLIPFAVLFATACHDDPPQMRPQFTGTIETIAGTTYGCEGDGGPAISAKLGYLTGVAVDLLGNVYISDGSSNTIRKINTSKRISTVAGNFIGFNVIDPNPYSGDGGMATSAHLFLPFGIAVDPSGNIYISDAGNEAIRKIDENNEINTIVGTGILGRSGDNGPATSATIYIPTGIAFDASGNLYFADSQNNTIRKVSTSGIIKTIAGTPGQSGYSGDGGDAIDAKLDHPSGIAIAPDGTIYFSDNDSVVRQISTSGKITTIAGTGEVGYSGYSRATEAKLQFPKGVAVAPDGSILIADSGNNRIRRVTPETGLMDTIAGTGVNGHSGDGGSPINASLSEPYGLAVTANGYIYVAEAESSVVRLIKPVN